jgi:DNA polymerase-3 subunit beta
MKIVLEREDLSKSIQIIQAAINSKTGAMPVLQNFLIETEKNGLNFISTDLEIAIKHFIETKVNEQGSITIPLKKFSEIIQNFDDKDVIIAADEESKVILNNGKTKVKIIGLPKSDYPLIPEIEEKDCFEINAYELLNMIESTIFSVSNEDERHFLNGLLWENKKNNFSIVATDGRRLAVASSILKIKKEFRVIIPSKIMNELTKFIKNNISDKKENIKVGMSTNQVGFIYKKTVFISKFIEGNFPAYEQIIPKEIDFSVNIPTEKLLSATKRAIICSNERNASVKYSFKKGLLLVNTSSQNIDFEDEFDIDYKGKDFQIVYNPKFILDILKNIGSKEVLFEFTGANRPSVIKNPEDKNLLYIVMPLRQ